MAAEFAVDVIEPGDPRVGFLVGLVIEAGAEDKAKDVAALVVRLKKIGIEAKPTELEKAPPRLKQPPPTSLVTDAVRRKALESLFAKIETHLKDPDLTKVESAEGYRRLETLRASKADVRTKSDLAWSLLESIERSLHTRTRETGEGD